MAIGTKEQIKSLLAQRNLKLKDLAEKMNEKCERKYTANSLSQRLGRRSITYSEILVIAEILDYEIQFVDKTVM